MLRTIIPWNSPDEIYRSIPGAVAVADDLGGEVILVNYSGGLSLNRLPRSRQLCVDDVARRGYLNKASANNAGAKYANYPVLCFCDCDILLERDVVSKCGELARSPRTSATVAHVQQESLNSLETTYIRCLAIT
jgi:hypothetical protein